MGAGHSGSTLLDIILGNHPEIQNCGELNPTFFNKLQNNNHCTCGNYSKDCPFWNRVIDKLQYHININNLNYYKNIQEQIEDKKFYLRRETIKNKKFNEYTKFNLYFLRSIAKVSDKYILVDSSKNPLRALNLSLIPEIELILIHLVRDGRAVTWSNMKKKSSSNLNTMKWSTHWSIMNFMSEIVYYKTNAKKIRIRYEDLVTNPEITLNQIEDVTGLDFTDITTKITNYGLQVTGHSLEGNRLRFKSNLITLNLDNKWKHNLTYKNLLCYWAIAWPFSIKYGYF